MWLVNDPVGRYCNTYVAGFISTRKGKGSQGDAQKVLGYCTANAPLGSTALVAVVMMTRKEGRVPKLMT